MTLKKGDFIEIRFTGRVKGGDVFDSNNAEDLKKANIKGNPFGFIFAVGQKMFIKGVDEFLIGKDIGKYNIDVKHQDAFGKRDPKLIQMIPMKVFIQHKINPIPGSMFNFDNKIAKVLTVSGGRVMVDFNNTLAGKDVEYDVEVVRKVEDQDEKVNAVNDFFFRKKFEFTIDEKTINMKIPKEMEAFVFMFADKYKEILGLELKTSVSKTENTKKE